MVSIYEYVLRELPKHQKQFPAIAQEIDVSHSWLRQVASQKIPNPGVRQIEKLAGVLKKRTK